LGLLLAEELLVAQAFAAQDILVYLLPLKHLLMQELLLVAEVDQMWTTVAEVLLAALAAEILDKMVRDIQIHTAKAAHNLLVVLVV
jgi:hypothetical protein